MRLSMSFSFASCSNRGLSGPVVPATASTTWPPGTGPLEMGSIAGSALQPASRTAATAMSAGLVSIRLTSLDVLLEPDVRDGDDEERGRQHPGGVVELALEAAPGAVPAPQPAVAPSDGPSQSGCLGRLQQHSRHQQDGDDHLEDDERASNLLHWNRPRSLAAGGKDASAPFPPGPPRSYRAAGPARACARRVLTASQFTVFHQAAT